MIRGVKRQAERRAPWSACATVVVCLAASVVSACAADPATAAPMMPDVATASGPERLEVMVDAAASLREALQAIAPVCEKEAGARLVFNFGASNDLARQILAADKADIFFSADESWMDKIAGQGLIDTGARRSLLSNRLVVIVPLGARITIAGPNDLAGPGVKRIALADPEAVPAGKYARGWLEKTHQWDAVREKIVPALDVRAALAAVEAGAVDAGVVYRTDATISKKVRIAYEVPEGDGPRISYAVAALKGRPRQDAARRVVKCLAGEEAGRTFEAHGFIVTRTAP